MSENLLHFSHLKTIPKKSCSGQTYNTIGTSRAAL